MPISAASPMVSRLAAPPVFRQVSTQDVDAHAQGLRGWQMRYDQLTAGRFHGEVSELRLAGLQLVRDRSNQAMLKRGQTWPGAVCFTMPLGVPREEAYCGGHQIRFPSMLVARGAALPDLRTAGGLELLCIGVDETLLADMLEQQHSGFRLGPYSQCLPLSRPDAAQAPLEWQVLCDTVLVPGAPASRLASPAAGRGLHDLVMQHLLDLMDADEAIALAPSARKRIVDRACDYALACRDAPPSVLDICNRVGASRRKLQYCFQETLGINVVSYLRALRLNAVRRALCQGAPGASVQDIAVLWGFWHLSRFAQDYRLLFGERPSETLARSSVGGDQAACPGAAQTAVVAS